MIEFDTTKECAPTLHDFVPIVENNKTIGLICLACRKIIYEFVNTSDLFIDANGNLMQTINFTNLPYAVKAKQYKRKDGRF